MKKILLSILILIIVLIAVACGGNTQSNHSNFDWPSGGLADLIPVPEKTFGRIIDNTSEIFKVEIGRIKTEQFEKYITRCQENGFNFNINKSSSRFTANNEQGYQLEIFHWSSSDYITITVEIPINAREFQWPNSDIARLIDPPKSNRGKIVWEGSHGFVIYVGNTTKAEYDAYVNACADRGFTVDYRKGDDFYYAYNKDGYYLTLKFEGFDVMFIRLDQPKETDNDDVDDVDDTPPLVVDNGTESDIDNNFDSDTDVATSGTDNNVSTVTIDWKEFLREYEAWVDSYIEFMEKYNDSPTDLTLLTDYMKLMEEYLEWAEKAEAVEVELANSPQALKEYMETLTRIIGKLASIG